MHLLQGALMNEKARRNYISQCWDIVYQYDDSEWQQYITACSYLPNQTDWFTFFDRRSSLGKIYKVGVRRGSYTQFPTDQPKYCRHAMAHVLQHCRMVRHTLLNTKLGQISASKKHRIKTWPYFANDELMSRYIIDKKK